MTKTAGQSYDDFYADGGWTYDPASEELFLWYRVLQPLGIAPGGRALELGCGTGLHAALLHRLGLEVTAVDTSAVAIERAARSFPGPRFVHGDARAVVAGVPPASLALVFARGMSWFHYELGDGPNRHGVDVAGETDAILRTLRPDGYFVLQVRTDFSGRDDPESGVVHHLWEDVAAFFAARGEVVMLTDWCGLPLSSARQARESGRNVLVAVRPARAE
jgi:SAM-dependent methyltransferase